MKRSLVVLTAFVACRPAPAPVTPPEARAHVAPTRDARMTGASWAARFPGRILSEVERTSASGRTERVTFVETARGLVTAWASDGEKAGATPHVVEDWPFAVDLVHAFADDERGGIFAVVRSRAALDQPSGLLALVDVTHAGSMRLETAVNAVPASKAEDLRPALDPTDATTDEELQMLAKAAASDAAMRATTSARLDGFRVYQGAFRERMTPEELKPLTSTQALRKRLAEILRDGTCFGRVCKNREQGVLLAQEGGKPVVAALFVTTPDVPRPAKGDGVLVPATEPSARSEAIAAATDAGVLLREAPLDRRRPGATVAASTPHSSGTALVVADGAFEATLPLFGPPLVERRGLDVRFVDADGDGRTDVLVELIGSDGQAQMRTYRVLWRVPATATSLESLRPERDMFRALAVYDAKDLDGAARAAAAASSVNMTKAEACTALAALGSAATLKTAALPAASLLVFAEPGLPTWSPEVLPLAGITKEQWPGGTWWGGPSALDMCTAVSCDADGYCTAIDGPESVHVWFARERGRLRIAGLADYRGS